MGSERVSYEQKIAALAAFGIPTDPPSPEVVAALQSEDERSLSDILGKVEIRIDDHVVASSHLDCAELPDGNTVILRLSESISGDMFATSLPLSKYARGSAKLVVASKTVGTFPSYPEVRRFDQGEVWLSMVAGGRKGGLCMLQGELQHLTDEDIANLETDDTLIGRYLSTGEGLESSDVSFCPRSVQMEMTSRLRKLCETVGPLRKGVDGQLLRDPSGEAKQDIFLVHSELEFDEMYTSYDGFRGTPMKQIFASFLDQIRQRDENATLKSLRFTLNGKILFPSSVGKQTPHSLGMKHGDKIFVSTNAPSPRDAPPVEQRTNKTPKRKGPKKGKSKSRKRATTPAYGGADEKEQAQLLRLYSDVMAEAETKRFKDIRQRLNAMNLERTEPKVKTARQKQPPAVVTPPASPSDGHDDKAMKSRFVIHVGEVQNLYKSTKPSKRLKSRLSREKAITVDLHAMTKEEALAKLNNELPQLVNVAMRGDHPFVIPVVIICGKGSQVLSEVVEQWIGQNEKVANAPKNLQL